MADTSAAVALNRVSTVLGYSISAANFNPLSPYAPQRIAIVAEANHSVQSSITPNLPYEILSAADAANEFGDGSPIHQAARIVFPLFSSKVPCPVIVYPLAEASGATVQTKLITITGATTAAASGTIQLLVCGRNSLDGQTYNVPVTIGDTRATVATAIATAISNVYGSPTSAAASTNVATLSSKWYGLTAAGISVYVTDNTGSGFVFTITSGTAGTGTPDITGALAAFGNEWNTLVINGLGTDDTTWTALETFNGVTDDGSGNPTGRYRGEIMKPFVAFSGSVIQQDISLCDTHRAQVTNSIAPAPLSLGLPIEAAANMVYRWAFVLTNTPHLDVQNQTYPDMPLPLAIRLPAVAMNDYDYRDVTVKAGNSTCAIIGGIYTIKDSVTTFHPVGITTPHFRYVRTILGCDMNYYYAWRLIELASIINHALLGDSDVSTVSNTIKPKQVKALIAQHANNMVNLALITDAAFTIANSTVAIDNINPDRLDTVQAYKVSGYTRILATSVQAGFNNG